MSPRVGPHHRRWDDKFYPSVVVCAATTDDRNRSSTVCPCCSRKQRPCNLTTGVYVWIIETRTDRVTRPVQLELQEQGCNTKMEGRWCGVSTEGPGVAAYGFKVVLTELDRCP